MKSAPPKNVKASGSFSDLFPPSLIKDIRQSYKNPLYLTLLFLGLLYIGLGSQLGMDFRGLIFSVIAITCFILPMRAGMSVASDLKEQGSNFLMLSPLSPMQIIWGQFLSALLQAGLLCLLISPALHHALCVEAIEFSQTKHYVFDEAALRQIEVAQSLQFIVYITVTIIAGAAATTALMILNAIVPILCRVGLALIAATIIFALVASNLFYSTGAEDMLQRLQLYIPVLFIVTPLLLLLARRHYASPSEVSSGRLRLLCVLYSAGTCAWFILAPQKPDSFTHLCVSTCIVLAALAVDELLPLEQSHRSIIKRSYLRKTCSGMTLILMISCVAAAAGAVYLGLLETLPQSLKALPEYIREIVPSIEPATTQDLPEYVSKNIPLYGASAMLCFGLSAIYSFYAPLLLTNIVSARNNRNRFVIFACCVLGIILASSLILIKEPELVELMPFLSFTKMSDTISGIYNLLEGVAVSYYRLGEISQQYMMCLGLAAGVLGLLSVFLQRKR